MKSIAFGLSLATLLGAAATPALALDCEAGFRAFTHVGGESCIPADPQRIVSMRGEYTTLPLIELGANVIGSTGRQDPNYNDGKPYIRGATTFLNTQFEDGVLDNVGSPNAPDLETIAALHPDLIIIPSWMTDHVEKLEIIAPTVLIEWDQPVVDMYRDLADASNRMDVFEADLARYQLKLGEARKVIADVLGDPSEIVVATAEVLNGTLSAYKDYGTLTQVLDELGFSRPQIITEMDGAGAEISAEFLPELRADFLISTYNFQFGQPPSWQIEQWDSLLPGWREVLFAPAHNQHIVVDRELVRAFTVRGLETMLAVLVSQLAEREFTALAN